MTLITLFWQLQKHELSEQTEFKVLLKLYTVKWSWKSGWEKTSVNLSLMDSLLNEWSMTIITLFWQIPKHNLSEQKYSKVPLKMYTVRCSWKSSNLKNKWKIKGENDEQEGT